MKFLIQHNLINPRNLEAIKKATDDYPREFVGCIPISEEICSDEEIKGFDYIPYGSCLLSRIASRSKWNGLHYNLDKLNYKTWLQNRKDMVNDSVMSVDECLQFLPKVNPTTKFFIRPNEDTKQFSGVVMNAEDIFDWLKDMRKDLPGSYYIPANYELVLSKPKNIQAEWRWFVVDGKVISGSMYVAHNQMRLLRETDVDVIKEAQDLANIWLPHDCVVMDTALVDDEIKVLEFNCINSSGFYNHDIDKIFKALWERHN